MAKIRLTKQFKFEMAHALAGYDGLCANIHGHSYRLWVTIVGNVKNEDRHVKNGMVLDFSELKRIVKSTIINKYDHSLVLNGNSDHAKLNLSAFDKVHYLSYQPTSENLVFDFAQVIIEELPSECTLLKLVLSETQTSFAEWNAKDY